MGDRIQRRFALIINGDTEDRHLENVDNAIRALRAESTVKISVASTRRPQETVQNYAPATAQGIRDLIAGIASDDDDSLTVYTTGHGNQGTSNEGCVQLENACVEFRDIYQQLERIRYGHRSVVMDNCFSGGAVTLFANSRSTVIAQGSPGETVSCAEFSPHFWGQNIRDANGDGIITLQERFAHAIQVGHTDSHTQFYEGGFPTSLSGQQLAQGPFEARTIEVNDDAALQRELSHLQPGQLALVTFSADWCGPCQDYKPTFDAFSRDWNGRFLMLRAEGHNHSEEAWLTKYNISGFPTVAFLDPQGQLIPVQDRMRPLDDLMEATQGIGEEFILRLQKGLSSENREDRLESLRQASRLGSQINRLFPQLLDLLGEDSEELRNEASKYLAANIPQFPSLWPQLNNLLLQPESLQGAAQTLGKIASQDPSLVADFLARLSDVDPKWRRGYALALAYTEMPASEDLRPDRLINLAENDSDLEVRRTAIQGIQLLSRNTGNALIFDRLKRRLGFEDREIIPNILETLSTIGYSDETVLPMLLQYLNDPHPSIRQSAAVAIANTSFLSNQSYIEAFKEIMSSLEMEVGRPLEAESNMEFSLDPSVLSEAFPQRHPPMLTAAQELQISSRNRVLHKYIEALSTMLPFVSAYPEIIRQIDRPSVNAEYRKLLIRLLATNGGRGISFVPLTSGVWRDLFQVPVGDASAQVSDWFLNLADSIWLNSPGSTRQLASLIVDLLNDPSETVWMRMNGIVLSPGGEFRTELLVAILEDTRLKMTQRITVLSKLAQQPRNAVIERWTRVLWNSSNSLNRRMALALWQVWSPEGHPFLSELFAALEDSRHEVRMQAQGSLASMAIQSPAFHRRIETLSHDSSSSLQGMAQKILELMTEYSSEEPGQIGLVQSPDDVVN